MNTLFARTNLYRKHPFCIGIKILEDNGEYIVKKYAVTKNDREVLGNIEKAFELINKCGVFKTPEIIKKEDMYLYIKYLPYPTLRSRLEEDLIEKKYRNIEGYFDILDQLVKQFPAKTCSPYDNNEFISIFDPELKYKNQKKESCIDPFILDLNLDNVLVNEDVYYFIDGEWMFNFPVSSRFLVFRNLFNEFIHLQPLLKVIASESFPVYKIGEGLYLPQILIDKYKFTQKEIKKYTHYIVNFSNKAHIIKDNINYYGIFDKKELITDRIEEEKLKKLEYFYGKYLIQENELSFLRENIQKREEILNNINNSTSYKFALFLSKIKRNVLHR